ncbi:MAG: sugar phosphate nucleotidyltransferase [Nanoarchaeota archaeon]
MQTAIILAAGKGTRLMPLTKDKPKCLVEVNHKPFLGYLMNALQEAGITRFIIVVGEYGSTIMGYLQARGIQATYVHQSEALGTGHALLQCKDRLSESSFLVVGADNCWQAEDIKRMMRDTEFCYIGAKAVSDPFHYGVLEVEQNFLLKIHEKPKSPPTDLINTGLYALTPKIFPILEGLAPSPRGEIELTDALNVLAIQKKVKVYHLKGYWLDLGKPEDIPLIEKELGE